MSAPLTYRQELSALGLLIGPILISQLCQAGFGFIDTVMAGQISPLDLAAVATGNSLWLPITLLLSGIMMATTPLVAEAYGAQNNARIPVVVNQGLFLGFVLSIAGFFLLRNFGFAFDLLNTPENLRDLTQRWLEGVSWGLPAAALFAVLRSYCEALGRPAPVMVISLLGLALNVPANYVFIYGHFGLPAMGGPGCGWGTAVSMWAMCLMLFAYTQFSRSFEGIRVLRGTWELSVKSLLSFLSLGVPIGIAIFFEVSVFAIVAILISPLGEMSVAGHQIALSVTSLLFMFPLSLAICMTIRTGQAYGRQDMAAIKLTRKVGLQSATALAVLSATLIVIFREPITGIYSEDTAVRDLAAMLLLFAAAYQVVDALQVGAAGCLRGLQDTRSPMLMTLFAYWVVALPVGYSMGMTTFFGHAYGPQGFWTGLVLGLTVACVLLNWQLQKRIKRLEPKFSVKA